MYRSRRQKYSETNLFAVSATLAATESPMTESPHILIIEDDREIGSLVTRYLRANECRVTALAAASSGFWTAIGSISSCRT